MATSKRSWARGVAYWMLVAVGCNGMTMSRSTYLRRLGVGAVGVGAPWLVPSPSSADVPVDPFNSMCLGFGCNSVQGLERPSGIAKPVDEESIDWPSFLKMLDEKKVVSVEFDTVNMSKAWALVKDTDAPIRIGEGYPIEVGNSWCACPFVFANVGAGRPHSSSPASSRTPASTTPSAPASSGAPNLQFNFISMLVTTGIFRLITPQMVTP